MTEHGREARAKELFNKLEDINPLAFKDKSNEALAQLAKAQHALAEEGEDA